MPFSNFCQQKITTKTTKGSCMFSAWSQEAASGGAVRLAGSRQTRTLRRLYPGPTASRASRLRTTAGNSRGFNEVGVPLGSIYKVVMHQSVRADWVALVVGL